MPRANSPSYIIQRRLICWFGLTPFPFLCLASGGACGEVAVLSRVPAHTPVCSPSGIGHKVCHSTRHGWPFPRRCGSHPFPQEPRSGPYMCVHLCHFVVGVHTFSSHFHLLVPADLVRDWKGVSGRISGEESQPQEALWRWWVSCFILTHEQHDSKVHQ